MSVEVAIVLTMPQYSRDHLAEHYAIHYWPDPADLPRRLREPAAARIRGVQTNGSFGLKRDHIEAMPALEIICAVGAGFEGIDVDAARERGIVVTNTAGANAGAVSEHAWALLLATVRRVPWCDRGVREGRWNEVRGSMATVSGRRLGLFGLGHVGREIARRGALGFDMEVGYCTRTARTDVPYRYFEHLVALAAWCDVLVIAAPGGAQTRKAVDRDVLDALGAEGILVNIARGSIVDSEALIEALRDGRIAGAGLDVIDGEPTVPEGMHALDNLVLSPHCAAMSPAAIAAMIHAVRANLDAHFAGRPVPSPIPA